MAIQPRTQSLADVVMAPKNTDVVASMEKIAAASRTWDRLAAASRTWDHLASVSRPWTGPALTLNAALPSLKLERDAITAGLDGIAATARYQSDIGGIASSLRGPSGILGLSASVAAAQSDMLAIGNIHKNLVQALDTTRYFAALDSDWLRYPLGKQLGCGMAFDSLVASRTILDGYGMKSISDAVARQMSFAADAAATAYWNAPPSVRAAAEVEAAAESAELAEVVRAIDRLTRDMAHERRMGQIHLWLVLWSVLLLEHGADWLRHALERIWLLLSS